MAGRAARLRPGDAGVVDAVRAGESVEELIPVNARPTPEYAAMLAGRLAFIRENLIDADPVSLASDV